jgi:tetratricopeptide (TPR) repeat protein
MSGRIHRAWAGVSLATAIVAWPAAVFTQSSLAAARDLYASAAYEDALAALDRVSMAGVRDDERRAVDQYRAFCLLALGKGTEAEHAIEAVVSADPWYHPSDHDASPRVRGAFSDVRRRVLPALAQQKYVDAKAAFDRKDYRVASEAFSQVLDLFADPDMTAAAGRPPLADLRVLIAGFRELSLQAIAPPPAPEPPPAPVPVSVIPSLPEPPRIYASSDANVVPPAIVRQALPAYPGSVFRQMLGLIEVVIDEAGAVSTATIRGSITTSYDKQILLAAQEWRYKPAMLNGTPVKYRKLIQIALTPK